MHNLDALAVIIYAFAVGFVCGLFSYIFLYGLKSLFKKRD